MEDNTSKVYIQPANPLLSSPPATANGAGSPLFVINLCASMAPAQLTGKTLPGLDTYRLYQVSRVEDGRTRYRLRLGFFVSQQAADAVLAAVRKDYATAFTACLADEDRRYTRGYVPDTSAPVRPANRARPVAVLAPTPPPPPQAAKPAAPQAIAARAPTPPPAKPPAPSISSNNSSPRPAVTVKSAAPVPVTPPAKPAPVRAPVNAAPPVKVKPAEAKPAAAKPVDARSDDGDLIDELEMELSWETEAQSAVREPVRAQAPVAKPSKPPASKAPDQSDVNEMEISWEPPSLPTALAAKSATPAATTAVARNAAGTPAAPQTVPAAAKAESAIKSKPVEKTPPAAAKAPVKDVPEVKNPPIAVKASAPVKLELESAPATAAAPKPAAAPSGHPQPFHVGKGVDIPKVSLSLQQDAAQAAKSTKPAAAPPAAKQTPEKPAQPKTAAPAVRASEPGRQEANHKDHVMPASKAAPPSQAAMQPRASAPSAFSPQARPGAGQLPPRIAALPDLDSTQTIRALTDAELSDDAQEKWFAIQLVMSEQPVNLDAMPHLDIFEAYRLYSVASAGSGKIVHSLRLGFFREAVSAEAVSGYLKTFFPTPCVLRISAAEQLRFKDAPQPKATAAAAAKVAVEPKNDAKVIDLNHARDRAGKPTPVAIPTITMEVKPPQGNGNGDRSPTGAYRLGAIAAASRKSDATGSYKVLSPTLKPAAKSAGPATKRAPAVKPSASSQTGRYRMPPKKSLQDQLLDEAREVELSESGIRRLPKNESLLSRLVDKLKNNPRD